ncbi:ATP-binding cassette domain-containing protein [Peptoniphilus sp. GNH]|nr:putative cell division ATP-binding protein FtsE [Clostridiales bacterium KA00134]UHR02681.1 ATP-binding cassette domain-containing protein [Peptoniphilus sp. GNH]
MIIFENVYKEYKNGVMALYNLNLEVPSGDFVYLMGASGAGKSTLLKLLIREEKPTRGRILLDGVDITKLPKSKIHRLRRNISFVFQDFRLLKRKTVFENVAYTLETQGASKSEILKGVGNALELVDLVGKEREYPENLSGGENQRVSIARAIANDAPVLLCDEPTGNLDSDTAAGIMDALVNINKSGKTIIMATHAKDIVDTIKQRVVILTDGHVSSDVRKEILCDI